VVQKDLMKNRIIYLSCKTVVHVLEKSVAHILRRIGKKWPQLRNIYNNVCRMFYMRSMDRMKVKVTQSFLGFFSAKWRGQHGLHPLYYILWISMTLRWKVHKDAPTVRASKIFLWMDPYVSETNFYTTKINAWMQMQVPTLSYPSRLLPEALTAPFKKRNNLFKLQHWTLNSWAIEFIKLTIAND